MKCRQNILAHCFQKHVLCCSYTLFCGNHSCTMPLNRAPKTRSCPRLRDGNQKWQPSTFLVSVWMCAWVNLLGGYTETTERSPKVGRLSMAYAFLPIFLCRPLTPVSANPKHLLLPSRVLLPRVRTWERCEGDQSTGLIHVTSVSSYM